eukprot:6697826-Alexandrium_andersonii.AAC.1
MPTSRSSASMRVVASRNTLATYFAHIVVRRVMMHMLSGLPCGMLRTLRLSLPQPPLNALTSGAVLGE